MTIHDYRFSKSGVDTTLKIKPGVSVSFPLVQPLQVLTIICVGVSVHARSQKSMIDFTGSGTKRGELLKFNNKIVICPSVAGIFGTQ